MATLPSRQQNRELMHRHIDNPALRHPNEMIGQEKNQGQGIYRQHQQG